MHKNINSISIQYQFFRTNVVAHVSLKTFPGMYFRGLKRGHKVCSLCIVIFLFVKHLLIDKTLHINIFGALYFNCPYPAVNFSCNQLYFPAQPPSTTKPDVQSGSKSAMSFLSHAWFHQSFGSLPMVQNSRKSEDARVCHLENKTLSVQRKALS